MTTPENNCLLVRRCGECGGQKKMWWESLTPGLINALWKFAKSVGKKGVNKIHLVHDMTESLALTKTEYNNFQKLRYHALVAKVKENGEHSAGYWLLTKRGGDFLRGDIRVPAKVLTYKNVVQDEKDSSTRHISDFYNKFPHFQEKFEYEIADGRVVKIRTDANSKPKDFKVAPITTRPKLYSACCKAVMVNKLCTKCNRPGFGIRLK